MYPAPATSNFSKPSGTGISATISSAILRGALRNCFASSNENGMANSPISTLGGASMTMFCNSTWYFCRKKLRTCSASCFCRSRYTMDSRCVWQLADGSLRVLHDGTMTRKSLKRKPIITNASIDAGLTLMAALPMMRVPARASRDALCGVPADDSHANCLSRLFLRHQRRHVSRRAGGRRSSVRAFAARPSRHLNVGATLEQSRVDRSGISATKIDVLVNGEKDLPREEFWAQTHSCHDDAREPRRTNTAHSLTAGT